MILIFASLAIILTYVGVMVKRNGIPSSISDTFYSLKHKVWFGFSMIGTALLLMPSLLNYTPEIYQFLAFLMCTGLCFVGVAPNFKNGLDRPIHIAGASIAGLCSQIWTTLEEPFALFMWLAWILYIGISIKKNWKGDLISCFVKCKPLFWAEVIAFAIVYFTLFFRHLLK